jgi:hypothetical protein
MTVKELREQLERMPDDFEVKFAYDYGDYWNTMVCPTVESVDTASYIRSDYHRMDKVVDYDEEGYDNSKDAVILNLY